MNIAFVYERKIIPTAGGVERVTILLAEELRRRGHNIYFLSTGPAEWNADDADFGFPQLYFPSSSQSFRKDVEDFISSNGIEAVIVQGFHPTVLPALDVMPEGVKKVMVYHNKPYGFIPHERYIYGSSPWKSLGKRGKLLKITSLLSGKATRRIIVRKLSANYRNIISRVDRFVLLSERYFPRMMELTAGLDRSRIVAVNNPNTFELDGKEPSEEKENIVLVVARLSNTQKNLTGFIDVWEEFGKMCPDWKAVVLGDGEDREHIKDYARRKGVKNIEFKGNVSNVRDYYRKAKILCMTSAYEGWPMVLAEGMACSCVPVAYDSFEAVRDLIDTGVNGILVKPFKAHEMALAIDRIAGDERLRAEMVENGRRKIKEFSVDKIADRWENLLSQLIDR